VFVLKSMGSCEMIPIPGTCLYICLFVYLSICLYFQWQVLILTGSLLKQCTIEQYYRTVLYFPKSAVWKI